MLYYKLRLILIMFALQACAGDLVQKDKKDIQAPFDGKRFENIEPFADKSLFQVLKWRFTSKQLEWDKVKNQIFYKPKMERSKNLRITLIGHSTVLIQVDGINILTDPHYSKRSSPLSWIGPERIIEPAIRFQDLPPVDVVLISHNHYDHLDLPTLKKLQEAHSPLFLVGLGNQKLLASEGIKNIIEMDWWGEYVFQSIKIHFTPVQHWSARGIFDKRKTLWGGYLIEASKKIFFAGDTGYGKVFKMINKKYGKMDVGLIPIGAYEPRWFMKKAHVNPTESVKIFKDLELKSAIGIHFGTFNGLTDEPKDQPKIDLVSALNRENLPPDVFIAPEFGQEYEF